MEEYGSGLAGIEEFVRFVKEEFEFAVVVKLGYGARVELNLKMEESENV